MYRVKSDSSTHYRNRRRWLQAKGSLTARLRQHGSVQIAVIFQGLQRLYPEEAIALQCRFGYIREVALLVHGVPAVWARSATSCAAVQGPWKSLKTLGSRPLAELLFNDRHVSRSRLQSHRIVRHGPTELGLRDSWRQAGAQGAADLLPRRARSSLFFRHGKPLRVLEAFAPWIANLPQRCRPIKVRTSSLRRQSLSQGHRNPYQE